MSRANLFSPYMPSQRGQEKLYICELFYRFSLRNLVWVYYIYSSSLFDLLYDTQITDFDIIQFRWQHPAFTTLCPQQSSVLAFRCVCYQKYTTIHSAQLYFITCDITYCVLSCSYPCTNIAISNKYRQMHSYMSPLYKKTMLIPTCFNP